MCAVSNAYSNQILTYQILTVSNVYSNQILTVSNIYSIKYLQFQKRFVFYLFSTSDVIICAYFYLNTSNKIKFH